MKTWKKVVAGVAGVTATACGVKLAVDFTDNYASASETGVTYRTHIQTYGWQKYSSDGASSGTTGKSKRLEAINIKLTNPSENGSIEYRAHVQKIGWQAWQTDGAEAGTTGQAKRLEAIQIRLTGDMAIKYSVEYRVHVQTSGWLAWVKDGETAGTTGQAKRIEAIQIRLVAKSGTTDSSTDSSTVPSSETGVTDSSTTPSSTTDSSSTTPSTTDDQAFNEQVANEILRKVNDARINLGKAPLTMDPLVKQASDVRAKELVELYSHNRPNSMICWTALDEAGAPYDVAAENIATGPAEKDPVSNAEVYYNVWRNAPEHFGNIIDSRFTKVGISVVRQDGRLYGVQLFTN